MSKNRKFIFYVKGQDRPIVLTDDSDTDVNEAVAEITESIKNCTVCVFHTDTDLFMARAIDISAVHISNISSLGEVDIKKLKNKIEEITLEDDEDEYIRTERLEEEMLKDHDDVDIDLSDIDDIDNDDDDVDGDQFTDDDITEEEKKEIERLASED